jgi:hypothetical protein
MKNMHLIARVENGKVHLPKIEGSLYVEVKIRPIYLDPTVARDFAWRFPRTFKI